MSERIEAAIEIGPLLDSGEIRLTPLIPDFYQMNIDYMELMTKVPKFNPMATRKPGIGIYNITSVGLLLNPIEKTVFLAQRKFIKEDRRNVLDFSMAGHMISPDLLEHPEEPIDILRREGEEEIGLHDFASISWTEANFLILNKHGQSILIPHIGENEWPTEIV